MPRDLAAIDPEGRYGLQARGGSPLIIETTYSLRRSEERVNSFWASVAWLAELAMAANSAQEAWFISRHECARYFSAACCSRESAVFQ
jgi:hypothetical protein